MKLKKLVRKLSGYLDADRREQLEQYDSIKKVLKKLKKKNDKLREAIETTDDEAEREALQKKLDVIAAQRQKGLQLLRQLKETLR